MNGALVLVRKFFPDVKKVSDADESIVLEVTKKDSSDAKTKDHNHCAMAMACKRKFQARGVIVTIGNAYVIKGEGAIRFLLPESVSREIVSFDRKAGFAEGQYKLSAPWKSQRLGSRAGRKRNDPEERTKPENEKSRAKKFHHYTDNIRVLHSKR